MRLQLISSARRWLAPLSAATLCLAAHSRTAAADGKVRLSTDTLFYTDTDNVLVVSPQVGAHADLDERGGEVSARAVVDVVSAASVDVVSQASQRFSEVRVEGDVGLSKGFGDTLPGLEYRYSHEPDYDSHGVRGSVQRRLGTPDSVLDVGYGATFDRVGRTGTPADAFSESLTTHDAHVGFTQTIGPRAVLRGVYTLTVQNGYMEKPYRYVPLFDQTGIDAAAADGTTLDLDTFDRYRLDTRPAEEVPDRRIRHALALRAIRAVDAISGSLRLDYQFYADDWGITAHALEPAVYTRIGEQLRLAAFARAYLQSGASFWSREYIVTGEGALPTWRTIDRELSPYQMGTAGVRIEWERGGHAAYLEGSAMATHYDDYLFLDSRYALVAQGGFRWRL